MSEDLFMAALEEKVSRRRILDEAFTTLVAALDEKADWLEPAFWDASPEAIDELHAALNRFQERGGTK